MSNRPNEVINLLDCYNIADTTPVVVNGAVTGYITDDSLAIGRALTKMYQSNGGCILDFPIRPQSQGYFFRSPIIIDTKQYSNNSGAITIRLNGNKITVTHNGWGLDVLTNYFTVANGGRLGTKRVRIEGGGAVIFGLSTGLGGIRLTDVIMTEVFGVTVYDYTNGIGIQLASTSTTASTWSEENSVHHITVTNCATGIQTLGDPSVSFLGTRFEHIVVEGRANNIKLYDLQGSCWNSTFVKCGGFYNQNGLTGGQGFYLNGSYRASVFMACWVDSGPDSNGQGAATLSNSDQVVFGPNYTTDEAWFPTFITDGLLRPPNWRSKTIWLGPVVTSLGLSANAREVLRSPRTYYVSLTGNDANDGLTLATAMATAQAAVNLIYSTIDVASSDVKIQLSGGTPSTPITHTAPITVVGLPLGAGAGSLILCGDPATAPGSVILAVTGSGVNALTLQKGARLLLRNIQLAAASGCGIYADGRSSVTLDDANVRFGTCADSAIKSTDGAKIYITNGMTFIANQHIGWNTQLGGEIVHNGGVVTATNITFSSNFIAGQSGITRLVSGSFSAAGSSGSKGFVTQSAIIYTPDGLGASSSIFASIPGSVDVYVDSGKFASIQ